MMMVVLMTVLVIMYVTALAHLVLMLVMMFVYHMQFLLISTAKVRGPSCNRVANSTIIDYFCSR